MRRSVSVTGLAVISALALAGCSGGGGDPEAGGSTEKSEIVLWMYPHIPDENTSRDYWSGVEEDFEAQNENVDLVIELQPWDKQTEQIATAIASGTGPDLVLITASQALTFHSSGGLEPVTDLLESPDAYLENAIKAVTFDGDIYGVPIYHTATTTLWNTALLEQAGITELPLTWDEIKEAAPKLAAQGAAIMDYPGSPEMTLNLSFFPLLWQAGGSVFTEDGTDVAFDGPEGVEALQFLLDLKEMGGIPADAATSKGVVEGGYLGNSQAAMKYSAVRAEVDMLAAAVGEENVEVGMPLTGEEQVAFGTPGVLAVTAINEDLEAAMAVANYIASPEVSHELQKVAGSFPARTDSQPPGDDEYTLAFAEALEYAMPGEINKSSSQVMAALVPHLQAALQGQKSAQQALDDAAAEARDILSRAG